MSSSSTTGFHFGLPGLLRALAAGLVVLLLVAACGEGTSPTRLSPEFQFSHRFTREDSIRHKLSRAAVSTTARMDGMAAPDAGGDGSVSIVSIVPSSFQGFSQPQTITLRLAGPVTSVSAIGDGAISCSGTYGELIAYDSAGTVLNRATLQLIDPADCSPTENPDNVTFGAKGTVAVTSGVIARVELTPMSLLSFPVFDLIGHASASYSFTLGSGAAQPKCKAPVTSFGQAQGGWELEQYDHINKTIKQKGCALTSVAMALSAFGFTHDPGELNAMLNEDKSGYVGAGKVNWPEAVRLGSSSQLRYATVGSAAQMERQICSGNPVIVGVKLDVNGNPGHFVLVNQVNSDGSFQVVDPGHGEGTSHPLSDFTEGYSLRGAILPIKPGGTPQSFASQMRPLLVPSGEPEDASLLFVTAPYASLTLGDATGASTVADPAGSSSGILGSSAYVDRIDDDDTPFEIDALPVSSVAVPLGDNRYSVVVRPSASGPIAIQLQATTRGETSAPQVVSAEGTASVPLALDVVTTPLGFHAEAAADGYVEINRSCGRAHTVTNRNGLPLDLTYAVEGSSEVGAIHLDARPPNAPTSSTKLMTGSKGRISLYSQGREVYRADVPPGCD